MKKAIVVILITIILTLGLLVGCVGVIKGSGNLDTQEFNFSGFTRIEVGYAFEVEVVQSGSYSVSITADDNLFDDYIRVSKDGETLKISLKPAMSYISTTLRARITMPELYDLDFSEATHGTAQGFSSSHDFILDLSGASSLDMSDMSAGDIKFDISGASRVTGDITADDAEFEISGASTVQLQGSASDIDIDASGASHAELASFTVINADVNLSGASSGAVNLNGRLDVDLSGASNLRYIGEPIVGDIDISDSATLNKK